MRAWKETINCLKVMHWKKIIYRGGL